MPGALAPQRVSRGPEVPGAGNAASLGSAASGGGRKEPVISRPTPGVARPTSVAPASTAAAAAPCRLIPPPPSLADSEEIGCGERYRRGRGWMRRPAAGLLGRLLVCDPARRLSAVDAIRRVAALSSAAPSPWRGRRRGRASGRQVCRRGVRVPQRVRGRGGSLAGLLLVQLAGGGIEGSAPLRAALPTSCCSRARRLNAGGGGLGCLVCRARPLLSESSAGMAAQIVHRRWTGRNPRLLAPQRLGAIAARCFPTCGLTCGPSCRPIARRCDFGTPPGPLARTRAGPVEHCPHVALWPEVTAKILAENRRKWA